MGVLLYESGGPATGRNQMVCYDRRGKLLGVNLSELGFRRVVRKYLSSLARCRNLSYPTEIYAKPPFGGPDYAE
jgi:hypothetical protein